jgi:hypothetical protein
VNADGSCTLQALVPAAGTLSATAAGVVPVQAARARGAHAVRAHTARGRSSGSRQAAARERSGRGSRKGWTGAGSSRGSRAKLASRTVASATTRAGAPGLVTLALRVAPAYQAALRSNAGIYATVTVTFHGDGGGALSQTLQVSLRDRRRNSPSSPRRKDRGGAPRRRGRRRP